MTFLEFWENGQDRYAVLKRSMSSKIWPFISPWFAPELGSDVKMTANTNSTYQKTSKRISRDTCDIFSYSDLIWPDIYLDLILAWAPSSMTASSSLQKLFGRGWVRSCLLWPRHPVRRKGAALTSDLTLTRHSNFFKKKRLPQNPLVDSFRSPTFGHASFRL